MPVDKLVTNRLSGFFTQHGAAGIARDRPGENKCDCQNTKQDRNAGQDAPKNIGEHYFRKVPGGGENIHRGY